MIITHSQECSMTEHDFANSCRRIPWTPSDPIGGRHVCSPCDQESSVAIHTQAERGWGGCLLKRSVPPLTGGRPNRPRQLVIAPSEIDQITVSSITYQNGQASAVCKIVHMHNEPTKWKTWFWKTRWIPILNSIV